MAVVFGLVGAVIALPSSGYYVPYFTDVAPDYTYFNEINYVRQAGIAMGYTDGTFRPRQTVLRSEFVAMVVKAVGAKPSENLFRDCYEDVHTEWFANEVCYAKSAGWLGSMNGDRFGPGMDTNWYDANTIITKAFGSFPDYTSFPSVIQRQDAARMIYLMRGNSPVNNNVIVPQYQQYPQYQEPVIVPPVYVPPVVQPVVPTAQDNRDAYSAYNASHNYYMTAYNRPSYPAADYSTYPANNGGYYYTNNNNYNYGTNYTYDYGYGYAASVPNGYVAY